MWHRQWGWSDRRHSAENMAQWLKLYCPRDVLIPARRGEKRPAHAHAGGAWTWARYEWTVRNHRAGSEDLGLLLFDLCVIDVDDAREADRLEARFPELLAVPMETTARGRHYFLSRSAKADAEGYYDGAAQRTPHVDFKSRAWNGGSGFLAITPSMNKKWSRAPWIVCPRGAPPEISDAMLDAVAAPRHAPLRVALRFLADGPDALPLRRNTALLAACTYVKDMVEMVSEDDQLAAATSALVLVDDASGAASAAPPPEPEWPVAAIPAQFASSLLADVERVAAGLDPHFGAPTEPPPRCFEDAEAYEAHIASLVALADFMGAPPHAMAALRSAGAGGGRNRGDQMRIDHGWALACCAAARDAEAGRLVHVDAQLASTLLHAPLLPDAPHDSRWIMQEGPRFRDTLPSGARVLVGDPATVALGALPAVVLRMLRAEAGHLALAGGAALSAVAAARVVGACSDYDLFIYGLDGDAAAISTAADALVRRIAAQPEVIDGRFGVLVSPSAVTLRMEVGPFDPPALGFRGGVHVVQIILRVAKDTADILSGFDLPPAKVLITYEPATLHATLALRVLAAPEWVVAMRHGAYALDGRNWSRASALRVFKYVAKGFDALVPALRSRSMLRYQLSPAPATWWRRGPDMPSRWWRKDKDKIKHLDGFELLFALERFIRTGIVRQVTVGGYRFSRLTRQYELQLRLDERVNDSDVVRAGCALHLAQRTDYDTALKMLRRFSRALTWGLESMRVYFGGAPHADALAAPLSWRQPWSRAQFHPVAADVTSVLDLTDTRPLPLKEQQRAER